LVWKMLRIPQLVVILATLAFQGECAYNYHNQIDCMDPNAPRMNNIGYVLSGYDIYRGNPIPTYDIVDPGTRSLIFAAEYNGDMTPDYRYCTPEGISLLKCSGNCQLSFQTDFISGTYSYHEKMSGSVGVGGSAGTGKVNGSFGASIGWNHVNDMTTGGANLFTMSEIQCCVYISEMFEFLRPPFHPNFIAGLHTLTETYDEHSYRRFLESFGTHYVKKSTMGAIFGEQSMISAESWTYMVQQGWNIGIMAGMSAGFSGNINMTIDYNETERETFDRYTSEQLLYSRGAPPPADGQALTWASSTFDNPNVLSFTLDRIDNLYLLDYVSSGVVANLGKALDGFCATLVAEGELEDCNLPPPDPPIPKPRIWSHWSNFGEGTDYRAQECPEYSYVEKIRWKYQGNTYGMVDFKMKCHGELFWRLPAIGNPDGAWDPIMDCTEGGFSQLTAREDTTWAGVVNVEAKCMDSVITQHSNDDYRGEYNQDLVCGNQGQLVGMQVRQKTHHGITNFRILCA